MNLHRILSLRRPELALLSFVLVSLLVVMFAVGIVPSTAQSTEERELEDKIPKHLPIKVKIKKEKEKAFKDLQNSRWFRDLELEVTNTGNKPIYFLALLLELPELISESGRKLGYPLIYGRDELADFNSKVLDGDVSLKPGESYTFKIQDKWSKGMERMRARINKPDPKRIQIRFQVINFGDRTGFMGIDGVSVPQSQKRSCLEPQKQPDDGPPASSRAVQSGPFSQGLYAPIRDLPASNLRVNFSFSHGNTSSNFGEPQPDVCCPGTPGNCSHQKPWTISCQCGVVITVQTAACTDSFGTCNIPDQEHIECEDESGGWLACDYDVLGGSCASPTPSPSPSPSPNPSPSPTPTCDPNTRPNPTNCICRTDFPDTQPFWLCGCAAGDFANYLQYPQTSYSNTA